MKPCLYLSIFTILFLACQSAPMSIEMEEIEKTKLDSEIAECNANTNSGDCALQLLNIAYDLPEKECQVYDMLINIDTKFKAPVGLREGSTTRVDWEFFPQGNAGFWILPIEGTELSEGTIRVSGCFSYGEQDTLKITRSITDHDGIISNKLSIDIPRPKAKNMTMSTSPSEFKILSTTATLN